jgi:hypothetical protein
MRTYTAGTKTLAFAVATYLAATAHEPAAHAGCTTDVECKGTRICTTGQCVEETAVPRPAAAPQQPHLRDEARFTDTQLADLKAAGAALDAKDLAMTERLEKRGIGATDFVAAYREYALIKAAYPEVAALGSTVVETIAVANRMGLAEGRGWPVGVVLGIPQASREASRARARPARAGERAPRTARRPGLRS